MAELITLKHFDAVQRQYHIYRIENSSVAHNTHYHNYFQVCFVTRGEILHGQEGKTVTLGPGDAFIIPPGFHHSIHFEDRYSQMYSLSFDTALLRNEYAHSNGLQFLAGLQTSAALRSGEPIRLRIMLDKTRRNMLQSLMECLVTQQQILCPTEVSAAPSLISAIVYLLAQSYYEQHHNAGQFDSLVAYNSVLAQCTEYIDQNFAEALNLSDLTRRFGLSRSTFCAVFPQYTGLPLKQYITKKRILEAQVIIRANPKLQLSQVATQVGYEDFSTFYRNFLRLTGMSPSEYRKLCINRDSTNL